MGDDRARGLLRINLVILGEVAPDPSRVEQTPEYLMIAHVGARWIPE